MFEQLKKYLTDNPQGYWFKRKLYGWGWIPVTWQGWLVIAAFVVYLCWLAFSLKEHPGQSDVAQFIVEVIVGVVVLIFICYKKGESPKWQWGIPKEKNPKK